MNQQNAKNSSQIFLTFLPLQTLLIAFHETPHCDFFADQITAGHGLLKGSGEADCSCPLLGVLLQDPLGEGFCPGATKLHLLVLPYSAWLWLSLTLSKWDDVFLKM